MIILPTIYRPENLRRFIRHYKETGASLPVWLVFDESNAYHYVDVDLPSGFRKCIVDTGTRIGEIFNLIFKNHPHEDFYGIIADDVTPETYRWDLLLREACLPDKISWGFDGGHDETLPRHPFIGGDLVRRLGFISCPGVRHWYVDDAWRDIAEALDCGRYLPEVRMKHRHPTTGLAQGDRTYSEQPDPKVDQMIYNRWKAEELPALVDRLRKPVTLGPVEIVL